MANDVQEVSQPVSATPTVNPSLCGPDQSPPADPADIYLFWKWLPRELLVAASRYANRHHVTALDPTDAVATFFAQLLQKITIPADWDVNGKERAKLLPCMIEGVEEVMKNAQAAANRRREQPLVSDDACAPQGAASVAGADARDLQEKLVQVVTARAGTECAACFSLRLARMKLAEIVETLGIPRATVAPRLEAAKTAAGDYLRSQGFSQR